MPRQVDAAPLSLLDPVSLSNHSTENAVLLQQDQNELHLQKDMRNFDLNWDCSDSSSRHVDRITRLAQKRIDQTHDLHRHVFVLQNTDLRKLYMWGYPVL